MKAPFPYFGGKSRIAALVWDRFGDVPNYVEPFFGSGAVLLERPHAPTIETVNDLDCFVANFWRAVAAAPDEVAARADWPVNEADLHARHRWLVERAEFRERMRSDPEFFDARIAGWWVWGLSAWIGAGWCSAASAEDVGERLPMIGGSGSENRPNAHRGRGVHALRTRLHEVFAELSKRLRHTRVACGDWSRVVTDSVTWRHGNTAIFLDPPYSTAGRTKDLYAHDGETIAAEVRAWCAEHGGDRRLRIALCGYEREHNDLEAQGWAKVPWKAKGGYGNQSGDNANAAAERVWFSPHCKRGGEQLLLGGL